MHTCSTNKHILHLLAEIVEALHGFGERVLFYSLTEIVECLPEPGPGEALVAVAGAGACHSDLYFPIMSAEALALAQPPLHHRA